MLQPVWMRPPASSIAAPTWNLENGAKAWARAARAVNEACAIIQQAADEEANVIFGLVLDKDMKDEVKISVIATGFDAPAALASRREVSLPVSPSGARPAAERERDRTRTAPETPIPEDQGYGVNLINMRDPREDIFDIPTFLRTQLGSPHP